MYFDNEIEEILTDLVKERGIAKQIVKLKCDLEENEWKTRMKEHRERNMINLIRIKNLKRLTDIGATTKFRMTFVKMENEKFFNPKFSKQQIEFHLRRLERFWKRREQLAEL